MAATRLFNKIVGKVSCVVGIGFLCGLILPVVPVHSKESSNSEPPPTVPTPISGTILIVGNGPERYLLEILAAEFESRHPSVSVDIFWHPNAKPIRTIELNEADIGITGEEVPSLRSTAIARDGVAVLTNFSNPVKEMTTQQVADVFSGKIRYWSQVYEEAPQTKIVLINRTTNENIRQGFEKTLGIQDGIPRSAYRAGTEDEAIKAVSGNLEAITFVSMTPALRAKEDGVAINLLFINRVEPEVQTVLDNRYPLQRPVMLITNAQLSPQAQAFEQFALSREGQKLMRKGKFYPLLTSQ
ncbi:substrate-binding domain-containing protein [Candidatus Nitrospira allomarina]|jgi:phosphate transport system substrate-binding protein|uniref:Substrate-binding domain-containing protein n=1 Tax=Candidatus Nitrospira allomarina TaxID=3020900 RepID=A0AA96G8H7_9BACT|nr:substrate-binding domain-containing protein [Candidatus Nitrospira allomarina]WNM57113.1 substrate-binding domain-containing protein [Candidatus Nitrospira allomarina]